MSEIIKKSESVETGEPNGFDALANMPSSLEEYKKQVSGEATEADKYMEQAKSERDRWIDMSERDLKETQNMEPEDGLQIVANPGAASEDIEYRDFDSENPGDMNTFNEYKATLIKQAEDELARDKKQDLEELATCFKHRAYIDSISKKLDDDKELTDEEKEFLGDAPVDFDAPFDIEKFETPDLLWVKKHGGFYVAPSYSALLEGKSVPGVRMAKEAGMDIVARAQVREMLKQDRAMLHKNKEVRDNLEEMEKGRSEFYGENGIDSETGEARTFTLEDNYPQLEGETNEDYAKRLKRIQLKTRQFENKQ